MAKLFQLANNEATYGERAGWWMVVSDDGESELAGPFESQERAEAALKNIRLNDAATDLLAILKPFIEIWDRGGPDYADKMSRYWGYDNLSTARAIIAKAEGAQ